MFFSEYKDSNVGWIGKIPLEWKITAVRNGYDIKLGKMVQPEGKKSTDVLVPYLKAMNVQDGYIKNDKVDKMYSSRSELKSYHINVGDLLVCEGGEVARSAMVSENYEGFIFQNSIHRVRAKNNNSVDFLHYLLVALRNSEYIDILVNKSTIAHFTKDKFNSLRIPMPNSTDQKKIVTYIKEKEDAIQKLIQQKNKIIYLLEEQRQSIITEAVTKGLNPNVEMKDSGVEWIGEIPYNWGMKKVKYLVDERLTYGANEAAELDDENLPRYIRITDINNKGELKLNTFKSVPLEIAEKYPVNRGDILLARSGATVGKAYLHRLHEPASYAGYLIKLSFDDIKLAEYVYFFTNSSLYKKWINSILIQATIQNVSAEKYSNLKIPIPSGAEIKEIVNYLNVINRDYRDLIYNLEVQIEKLKEYRQSLIYEAATGKINVREMVSEK